MKSAGITLLCSKSSHNSFSPDTHFSKHCLVSLAVNLENKRRNIFFEQFFLALAKITTDHKSSPGENFPRSKVWSHWNTTGSVLNIKSM